MAAGEMQSEAKPSVTRGALTEGLNVEREHFLVVDKVVDLNPRGADALRADTGCDTSDGNRVLRIGGHGAAEGME